MQAVWVGDGVTLGAAAQSADDDATPRLDVQRPTQTGTIAFVAM